MPNRKNLVTILALASIATLAFLLRGLPNPSSPSSHNQRVLETLQEKVCSGIRTKEYRDHERNHFDFFDRTLNLYSDGRDELETAIVNDDFDEYYKWLWLAAIPWIILAVLAWAVVKFLFLWWCCPNMICCKKLRRETTTLTLAQDKKYGCGLIVLSVLTIIFLLASICITPHMYRGAKKTVCSAFKFTDRILDGDSDSFNTFQGFKKLVSPMQDVIAQAPGGNTAMSNAMANNGTHNTDWAKEYLAKMDLIEADIQTFPSLYNIPSPNPANAASKYSSIYMDTVPLYSNQETRPSYRRQHNFRRNQPCSGSERLGRHGSPQNRQGKRGFPHLQLLRSAFQPHAVAGLHQQHHFFFGEP